MSEFDTERAVAGLPMVVERRRERPSLQRTETTATFVSQLLAARANLAPQRLRRRAGAAEAVSAYTDGGRMAVARMPQGYRKTVVV